MGHDKLEIIAKKFNIIDTHGDVIFSADKDTVLIGANALHINGEGGAIFRESIETPVIRADPGKELK